MNKLPLNQFYEENENLIHFTSQKALKRFSACGLGERVEYDEIFSELREVFIKSYNQHNPEHSTKFSTYYVTACHNHVTNRIEKMYRIEIKLDSLDVTVGDEESTTTFLDTLMNEDPMLEAQAILESELRHVRERLTPFAQVLLDYSVDTPDFIVQEFHAQRAQCALASSLGLKTSHSTEINLLFVATCLKSTTDNPEIVKCIKRAVDEVRHAIQSTSFS